MAIPEHVKKQADEAITHEVTLAFIRLYGVSSDQTVFNSAPSGQEGFAAAVIRDRKIANGNGGSYPAAAKPAQPTAGEPGFITDDIAQQAREAVAHKITTTQIRLIEQNGSLSPIGTPRPGQRIVTERVARMRGLNLRPDQQHRELTRDSFGKE